MKRLSHFFGFTLALAIGAHGEIINGTVTDLATKAPIQGAKAASGAAYVLTDAQGKYTLNTAVTSVGRLAGKAAVSWDGAAGAFRWDALHGEVVIEVRNLAGRLLSRSNQSGLSYRLPDAVQGLLLVSVKTELGAYSFRMNRVGNMASLLRVEDAPGRSDIQSLVKIAAMVKVSITMAGYDVYSQKASAARVFDAALHKTGSLTFKSARQTWYTSYPDPGSEECVKYSGCDYMGDFAAIGHKSKEWVADHNLVAVHSRDFNTYKLKTLRLKYQDYLIDAQVVDMCADSDCGGCCTQNANSGGGFLIDLESFGVQRFGIDDGKIQWTCIDC